MLGPIPSGAQKALAEGGVLSGLGIYGISAALTISPAARVYSPSALGMAAIRVSGAASADNASKEKQAGRAISGYAGEQIAAAADRSRVRQAYGDLSPSQVLDDTPLIAVEVEGGKGSKFQDVLRKEAKAKGRTYRPRKPFVGTPELDRVLKNVPKAAAKTAAKGPKVATRATRALIDSVDVVSGRPRVNVKVPLPTARGTLEAGKRVAPALKTGLRAGAQGARALSGGIVAEIATEQTLGAAAQKVGSLMQRSEDEDIAATGKAIEDYGDVVVEDGWIGGVGAAGDAVHTLREQNVARENDDNVVEYGDSLIANAREDARFVGGTLADASLDKVGISDESLTGKLAKGAITAAVSPVVVTGSTAAGAARQLRRLF
jgi:hypothetical protein